MAEPSSVSRRRFLELAGISGVGALAAACGGGATSSHRTTAPPVAPVNRFLTPATKLAGPLSILMMQHFVPRYDRWFDSYAKQWGRRVGVDVTVDHVALEKLAPRTAAEIAARSGHDLIQWISPPSQLEPDVIDLSDVHNEAVKRFGLEQPFCKKASYNPATSKYYGYCQAWVADPGDYRKSMWAQVGMSSGPSTWEELLLGGKAIKKKLNVPVGIGMSNEIDSNMAARALLWSFGASVQNEVEEVVLNSPETIRAVNYMVKLYNEAMMPEIFSWNASSNNQGLISGQLSYILNSISAYRSAQTENPGVANDVSFTSALKGPTGLGFACQHLVLVFVIPKFAKNIDAAKEFVLNLSANDAASSYQSELYNFPAFPELVPQLDGWLGNDPFGSRPTDKLKLLQRAAVWTADIGYPGPPNPAIGKIFTLSLLPQMMARVAQGKQSAQQSVAQADGEVKRIFEKWRSRGLLSR